MKMVFSLMLLMMSSFLVAMDEPVMSPKHSPEGQKLREIVIKHLNENETKQAEAEPVKDSNYYKQEMSSPFRNLVNTPPAAIKAEVEGGPLCFKDNNGVLCAAHTLFLINLIQNKIIKTVNIPSKIEYADRHRPAVCCVAYGKLSGIEQEQILLGEMEGRVLIADPKSYAVKTFGHVPGKVLGFYVNPQGKMIAIRYESKDEAGKPVPCFAVAQTYAAKRGILNMSTKSLAPNMAQSDLNKRRSWAPPVDARKKVWSHFASQSCNHEVKNITFEKDSGKYYCITYCATGTIEKWEMANLDTDPKLVKVAHSEQLKP